jgi:hypothetical protein
MDFKNERNNRMKPRDRELAQQIETSLLYFGKEIRALPGIENDESRNVLVEQLLDSIHRVRYVSVVRKRNISLRRADPKDGLFDPLKAAILHQRDGNVEEAFWCVFLFVHFGKNELAGWRYAREIYGRLGQEGLWDWANTSADPHRFREWLNAHQEQLRRNGMPRGFGNHRKYQSLDAYSPTGTGAAVESYVKWVSPPRTHQEMFKEAYNEAGQDRRKTFDHLYRSMDAVISFGRTARFDYLAKVGNLDLAPVEPGSTYLKGATGPFKGARLLFGGSREARLNATELEAWLGELEGCLGLGMQVLEDALCNWQKSPGKYESFRA